MTRSREPVGDHAPVGEPFRCAHCGRMVPGTAPGTMHRNHCPWCLWALHVDIRMGDRLSGCRGGMDPIAIAVRKDGEWALVHCCRKCGKLATNRIAGDDSPLLLISLAVQPLARPPFPLDRLEEGDTAGAAGGTGSL